MSNFIRKCEMDSHCEQFFLKNTSFSSHFPKLHFRRNSKTSTRKSQLSERTIGCAISPQLPRAFCFQVESAPYLEVSRAIIQRESVVHDSLSQGSLGRPEGEFFDPSALVNQRYFSPFVVDFTAPFQSYSRYRRTKFFSELIGH